jgi:hypothetical protein
MPTTTTARDRTDEIRTLEELWAAPAAPEPAPARGRALPRVPGALLAAGWVAFLVLALAFQPEPEPGMTWAPWAVAVEAAMFGLLFLASAFGSLSGKVGFGAAAVAGPLLVALAVNCRAAEHHLGNWWLAELAAAVALTGLAALGLAQRLRS